MSCKRLWSGALIHLFKESETKVEFSEKLGKLIIDLLVHLENSFFIIGNEETFYLQKQMEFGKINLMLEKLAANLINIETRQIPRIMDEEFWKLRRAWFKNDQHILHLIDACFSRLDYIANFQ